jgi:hypothetical protein
MSEVNLSGQVTASREILSRSDLVLLYILIFFGKNYDVVFLTYFLI